MKAIGELKILQKQIKTIDWVRIQNDLSYSTVIGLECQKKGT